MLCFSLPYTYKVKGNGKGKEIRIKEKKRNSYYLTIDQVKHTPTTSMNRNNSFHTFETVFFRIYCALIEPSPN